MNCKQGDLAIVIRDPGAGAIVEVLREINPRMEFYEGRYFAPDWLTVGTIWEVRSLGGPLDFGAPSPTQQGPCPDRALRPIRPGEEPVTVERREEVPA